MDQQAEINMALDYIGKNLVGRPTDIFALQRLLQSEFGEFGVKIDLNLDADLRGCDVPVLSGYYEGGMSFMADEDDEIEIDIEIVLSYANTKIDFSQKDFEDFKFQFSRVLQHELIHRYQQSRRGDKQQRDYKTSSKAKEYYGNADEIDARAHDISLEITRNKCYNLLHNPREASLLTSETLFTYVVLFNSNSKVFKRLMKKVYQCINLPMCQWKS